MKEVMTSNIYDIDETIIIVGICLKYIPENKYNPYTNGYNANARVRVDSAWFNADGSIGDTVIVKPLRHRSDLISTKIVNIYPDTIVWMRDFSYSYNEPMMHNYFAHPSFDEFPIVGVSQ